MGEEMNLDLRKDFADIYEYVKTRVASFGSAANIGPGGPGLIRMIDIGFQCDQAGWVSLIFDTRPDAEPDGEGTRYIAGNTNIFPGEHWHFVSEELEHYPVAIVTVDGSHSQLAIDAYDQLSV